jgi:putative transposase
MAGTAVAQRGVSIALACRAFSVSETCFRYRPKLADENDRIADLLVGLTRAHTTWGSGLCFLYLRNVKGQGWNHKRIYRIYRELGLNLRIKLRKRLKRDKPDTLAVPESANIVWSMFRGGERVASALRTPVTGPVSWRWHRREGGRVATGRCPAAAADTQGKRE